MKRKGPQLHGPRLIVRAESRLGIGCRASRDLEWERRSNVLLAPPETCWGKSLRRSWRSDCAQMAVGSSMCRG